MNDLLRRVPATRTHLPIRSGTAAERAGRAPQAASRAEHCSLPADERALQLHMASAASMNPVAVCPTEVADVRRPGLEDPQAEEAERAELGRVGGLVGCGCPDKIQCLDCRTGPRCPLGQAKVHPFAVRPPATLRAGRGCALSSEGSETLVAGRPARVRVRVGLQGPPGGSEALEAVRDENDVDRTQRSEHDHYKAPRLLAADSSENQEKDQARDEKGGLHRSNNTQGSAQLGHRPVGLCHTAGLPTCPRRVQRFGEQIAVRHSRLGASWSGGTGTSARVRRFTGTRSRR